MTLRSEILALKGSDGLIDAKVVREWALKNPKSVLYKRIDWDVERGAYEWQLQQIREIIKVSIVNESRQPIAVSLMIDRVNGGGYRLIDDIIPVMDWREAMLGDVLRAIEELQKRYAVLTELCRVWDEANKIKRKISPSKRGPKLR